MITRLPFSRWNAFSRLMEDSLSVTLCRPK